MFLGNHLHGWCFMSRARRGNEVFPQHLAVRRLDIRCQARYPAQQLAELFGLLPSQLGYSPAADRIEIIRFEFKEFRRNQGRIDLVEVTIASRSVRDRDARIVMEPKKLRRNQRWINLVEVTEVRRSMCDRPAKTVAEPKKFRRNLRS